MTVLTEAVATTAAPARLPALATLRFLLLGEAALTLALAVFFSVLAASVRDFLGADAEANVRFAAGAAFLFAVFAAIAARGARRRRRWAWTMAAILQVLLAIGTSIAVMTADWNPAYLAGFAFATVVMLVLSTPSVRRALGQI